MASNRNITSKDCIYLANDIIIERNLLIPRLTSIKDINCELFCLVLNSIFNIDFLAPDSNTRTQQIDLISTLLSTLSNDLIAIPLEHIKPEDIVDKNVNAIYDLLEIINTFIKYVPKQFDKPEVQISRNVSHYKQNKDNSIKNKFHTKGVQANCNQNHMIHRFTELSNDFLNLDRKLSNYPNFLKSSSSSSSASPQSSHCTCPDIINSTSGHSNHSNSCGDSNICYPKQELKTQSKAIQTEAKPKRVSKAVLAEEISFDDYKKLQEDNFATELGYKLHEAFKLKQLSQVIEYKIKRYYGDVTVQTPMRSKTGPKLKNRPKHSIQNKKSPISRRKIDLPKVKTPKQILSLDDLIKAFPEISRNTIKSLREQEKHQQTIVDNLNKDIAINEAKVKSKLSNAIETQNKRSQIIKNEMKHLERLAGTKNTKLERMKENTAKRDCRIEKARMHKMVESYHREMMSRYKRLQAIEERLVIEEYEKRHKAQQENIEQFRKRIRETHAMEMDRQQKMLDAFETLYRNKFEMLSENLSKQERQLKNQISQQSHYLRSMKNEYKQRFENDLRNLFYDKS